MNTENRFSPSPADQRNQADLRHPERTVYRCFLTDLAGFTDVCRAGPDYADRQDRKKTGLFRFFSAEHLYYTPAAARCQLFFNPGPGLLKSLFPLPLPAPKKSKRACCPFGAVAPNGQHALYYSGVGACCQSERRLRSPEPWTWGLRI